MLREAICHWAGVILLPLLAVPRGQAPATLYLSHFSGLDFQRAGSRDKVMSPSGHDVLSLLSSSAVMHIHCPCRAQSSDTLSCCSSYLIVRDTTAGVPSLWHLYLVYCRHSYVYISGNIPEHHWDEAQMSLQNTDF